MEVQSPGQREKQICEGRGVEKQSKEDVVREKKSCCVSRVSCPGFPGQ